ncbi:MAG: hypothetical protein EBS47_10285 [Betaproteobacteria bacterium]|nr:hypothetical protein [Betaproteobacteria bacterium]
MESSHWPLILIEGVLVFGGALAFGWWQLRSVKRDRERLLAERERQRVQDERESRRESAQPLEGPPKDH